MSSGIPPGSLDDPAQPFAVSDQGIILYSPNYDGLHRAEDRREVAEPKVDLAQADFERFRAFISDKIGLHYAEDQRRQLMRGLTTVLASTGCKNINELYNLLALSSATSAIWDQVVSTLTIGETYFFRNSSHFDALAKNILPEILQQHASSDRRIRIWSAGCATGEEPYSIAILLREMIPNPESWTISILATDLNREALAKARQGVYAAWSFRGVEKRVQETYFRPAGERLFALADEIKQMVTFDYLNLAQDAFPSLTSNTNAMDVIFCRNVTIYFDAPVTQRIINNFRSCLVDGGWYIPGPSEPNMLFYTQFEQRNFPGAVMYHKTLLPPAPSVRMAPPLAPYVPKPVSAPARIAIKTAPPRPVPIPRVSDPFQTALELLQQGRADEAQAKLYEKIDREPGFVPAYYTLGKLYANKGDLPQAQHWCEQAIAKDRLNPAPYYILSMIYQENGLIDNAIEMLKKLIFLDRDFVLAHYNLGQIYRRQNEKELARRALQNAQRLLQGRATSDLVPEGDGLRVGRLVELIQSQMEN